LITTFDGSIAAPTERKAVVSRPRAEAVDADHLKVRPRRFFYCLLSTPYMNREEVEEARRRLTELLEARGEWWVREGSARGVEVRRGEWELRASGGGLSFSYWGAAGARAWRVSGWEERGGKLVLAAARRMGAERARLELVPRASVAEGAAVVAASRRAACERLAALVAEAAGAGVVGARLSRGARRGEVGRYARVRLRKGRGLLAATGPVVPLGTEGADAFLAAALLWFARLGGRRRAPEPSGLWLVAPPKLARAVAERLALLNEAWRAAGRVFEVDEEWTRLTRVGAPGLCELLERPGPRLKGPGRVGVSGLAERVHALAPEAVDVVRARRGETLRFRGLPFARVRTLAGREQLWFGVGREGTRRPLEGSNWDELLKLVGELAEHRRPDAAERAHALYRAAPEAWLEWLLRRDVARLDPGLRLAPLHAQLRTAHASGGARPLDLLALRRDGRLAVVELKVSEDAAHALQGADYWRRIYAHHRAGHIRRARLFPDAEISDDPPLVYLVAPLLRFHRAFDTIARALRPDIPVYRFDLNEDWRSGIRVARRCALT
jgi:hypothetical protein